MLFIWTEPSNLTRNLTGLSVTISHIRNDTGETRVTWTVEINPRISSRSAGSQILGKVASEFYTASLPMTRE